MSGKKPEKVSEEFEDAFTSSAGTIHATCELCGRNFIASEDAGDYDEGEYEEFLEKAKKEPDRYLVWSAYSAISLGWIDGKQFVFGCPCNALARYEQFIWTHRAQIVEYLRKKTERRLMEAQREAEKLNVLDGLRKEQA